MYINIQENTLLKIKKFTISLITFALSPTYWYADFRKKQADGEFKKSDITALIKKYNNRYLFISISLAIGLGLTHDWNDYLKDYEVLYISMIVFLIWFFLLSRNNEIFYAFIKDALDKVSHQKARSELQFSDRIRLALKSYLELVVNFGVIFYLLPYEWFNNKFESIFDALYFSGVTITTLGYGDFSPTHFIPQILVVYEVFCGFILLIVSFAIYAGRGLNEKNIMLTPDDICVNASDSGLRIKVKEDDGCVFIEGSKESLIFLSELIASQANCKGSSGFQISPNGAGNKLFEKGSNVGFYLSKIDRTS